MTDETYHLPVMAEEIVQLLAPAPGRLFVDGTIGGGGHAARFLEAGARVIGIDRDPAALAFARTRLAAFGDRVSFVHARFDEVELDPASVDGALLDLGVSSRQLDDAARGFSFTSVGPLDMRMDPTCGETAADFVNTRSHGEIAKVLREYGEEKNAGRIASEILKRRPLATTRDLVEATMRAFGGRERLGTGGGSKHVATRTFQALRIAVNGEMEAIEAALPRFLDALKAGGRLAVLSFHSLEDRIVKHTFRDWATGCVCPPDLPVCACGRTPRARLVTRKGVRPSEEESRANPRARSATLRVIEKTATGVPS